MYGRPYSYHNIYPGSSLWLVWLQQLLTCKFHLEIYVSASVIKFCVQCHCAGFVDMKFLYLCSKYIYTTLPELLIHLVLHYNNSIVYDCYYKDVFINYVRSLHRNSWLYKPFNVKYITCKFLQRSVPYNDKDQERIM